MKTILSALLVFISIAVLAQSKWQVGVNFSPEYSYRKLTSYNKVLEERRNNDDKAIFGFSTGLNLTKNISSNWALQFGLQFQKRGYKIYVDESDAVYYLPIDGEPFVGYLKAIQNMIQVPISVLYTLGTKKVKPFVRFGIQPGVWINESYGNYALEFGLASTVGAGIRYTVSTTSELRFEPCHTLSLVPYNDSDYNEKLWTLGLNVSYYKTF